MMDTTSRDVACSRRTSVYIKICHRCCEPTDTHALSRPTVDLGYTLIVADFRYQLIPGSLIFCYIFGRRNGGRPICGAAYTRVR